MIWRKWKLLQQQRQIWRLPLYHHHHHHHHHHHTCKHEHIPSKLTVSNHQHELTLTWPWDQSWPWRSGSSWWQPAMTLVEVNLFMTKTCWHDLGDDDSRLSTWTPVAITLMKVKSIMTSVQSINVISFHVTFTRDRILKSEWCFITWWLLTGHC